MSANTQTFPHDFEVVADAMFGNNTTQADGDSLCSVLNAMEIDEDGMGFVEERLECAYYTAGEDEALQIMKLQHLVGLLAQRVAMLTKTEVHELVDGWGQ
jgi:hypothetical protein